jgi:hypothetical protein
MYKGLAGMKEPATLLVYWDGKTKIGDNDVNHSLLKYRTDGKGNINGRPSLDVSATLDEILDEAEIIKEYPSQCSTDKEVMIEVLNDMTNLVTVDKIGLIAGSHASSWVPASSSRAFGDDAGKSIQIIDMVEAIVRITDCRQAYTVSGPAAKLFIRIHAQVPNFFPGQLLLVICIRVFLLRFPEDRLQSAEDLRIERIRELIQGILEQVRRVIVYCLAHAFNHLCRNRRIYLLRRCQTVNKPLRILVEPIE